MSLVVGFEASGAPAKAQCLSLPALLPANPDVGLLVYSPEPCQPARCHVSHHDHNGLKLPSVSQPHLHVFLSKGCCGHGVFHSNSTPKTLPLDDMEDVSCDHPPPLKFC